MMAPSEQHRAPAEVPNCVDAMLDLLKNPDHWQMMRSHEDRYSFSVEAFSLDQLEACPKCLPLVPKKFEAHFAKAVEN